MLNIKYFLKLMITLESIIISTMLPSYISVPIFFQESINIEVPINWQLIVIIFLTIILSGKLVINAFTIYIILGLFFLPVFHDGGSLGYIITPNFGYILGTYPLIYTVNKLNKEHHIYIKDFLKIVTKALFIMHLVGIIYILFQLLFYSNLDDFIYLISKFSLSKLPMQILFFPLLIPLLIPFNKFKFQTKQ